MIKVHKRLTLGLGLLLGTFFLGGCSVDTPVTTIETQERQYLEANTLAKQGRTQEALAAYLKVIAKRGDQAPESHLNVGIIYLEQIKDPIAAIYYFRRYLELVPNSKLGDRVKGLIETAKRDFARSLPVQPQDNIAGHLDGLDQIERLQRQNDELNAELASLRAGMALPPVPYHAVDNPVDEVGLRPLPQTSGTVQVLAPNQITATAAETSSADDNIEATAPPVSTSTHASRTHTIVKGDTWFSLAKKYYGSGSKWPQIVAANRDQLKGDHPALRVGMVLKIP